jgi:hypothetical protein
MAEEAYGQLPFNEAIAFFRQKVNVASPKWTDLLEGAHSRAFTVAGATKEGMLVDFRAAIDKAIAQGTTLDEFRKDFDNIVTKYGWDYKGTRGWRTRVIYDTNMRTAYAAGRWQQMTDPDVVKLHPFWRYRHNDAVKHPRPEHLAWNGLTLAVGDAWWKTHYPPNGWGCQCFVEPVTRRELAADGKTTPDRAPPTAMRKATLSTSAGPVTLDVPRGVDPGWGYSVGETAFGSRLPEATMQAWREQGQNAFERLTPGDWHSAGLARHLPIDDPAAKLGAGVATVEQLRAQIARAIGAEQKVLETPDGEPVLLDAAALSLHMPLDRAAFVPLIPELISNPAEIWLAFEKHKGTGQVVLRKRIIKLVRDPRGRGRGMLFVAQASRGVIEAWTLLPTDRLDYLNAQRVGRLMWKRSEDVK